MKGGLRMDLSCITGTFSAVKRMLSHRKWLCIKEEEIVHSLFLHAIKYYFQHPIYMSQTAKTMLLGALIATAGLWIFIMTVAMGYVTFRVQGGFIIVLYVMSHFV
jgi:hypothetical protein